MFRVSRSFAKVRTQLSVVFSHYLGVFILNACSALPRAFHCSCCFSYSVFVFLFGKCEYECCCCCCCCNCNDWIFMNTFIKAPCHRQPLPTTGNHRQPLATATACYIVSPHFCIHDYFLVTHSFNRAMLVWLSVHVRVYQRFALVASAARVLNKQAES